MVYADYREVKNGEETAHPVIDYQKGSLRDDFNFGPVQFYRTDVLKAFRKTTFNLPDIMHCGLHASRWANSCAFLSFYLPWWKPIPVNRAKNSSIM
jgi:hypothetical protein